MADEATDDPVATCILECVETGPTAPQDVARRFAAGRAGKGDPPDAWRRYLMAVRQQGIALARQGRIEIVRKGAVIDPSEMKGLVKFRRTTAGGS